MKLVITLGLVGSSKAGKFDAFLTAEEDIHAAFVNFMGELPPHEIEGRVYEVINLPNTHAGRALAGIVSLEEELDHMSIRDLFLKIYLAGRRVR